MTATVTTPSGSLNLRNGPSSSAKVISTIPYGDMMVVISRGSKWCAVIYNGMAGYVMTKYLTFGTAQTQPAPTATPLPTQIPMYSTNTQAMVTTTGSSLNLREAPDSQARVILEIPYGTWITVTARGTAWCQVRYNNIIGYVMTKYLSFGAVIPTAVPTARPAATYAPAITNVGTAWVNTPSGSLNLREAPDANAHVIGTIPYRAQVSVQSRGVVWTAVSYNGMTGYVMTSFLRFADTPAATTVPTAAPTQSPANYGAVTQALITTSGGTLNLREQPSYSSRVILAMPNASAVTVYR